MARLMFPTAGRRPSRKSAAKQTDKQLAVETLAGDLEALRLANPHLRAQLGVSREVPFAGRIGRQWRADFAYIFYDILIEVEGGTWLPPSVEVGEDGMIKAKAGGGRHNRGAGYAEDCIKYSWASILGHTLIRVTTGQVMSKKDSIALDLIKAALKEKGARLSD